MDRRPAFRRTPGYATASGCRCAVLPLSRFMARTPCPMPLDVRRRPVHPAPARRTRPRTMDRKTPESGILGYTSGGGDRFSGRMILRIGQQAATVPVTKQERLPCPRAIAT